MRARRIRQWLTRSLILLWLVVIASAGLAVWASDGRQWYVDGLGIDIRLDMVLAEGGRWLATVVLVGLALLGLLALAFELAMGRGERAVVRGQPSPSARYGGVVLGGEAAGRVEQSPPADGARVPIAAEVAALRAAIEQVQRQLDEVRGRLEQVERPVRERIAAGA